MSVGGFVLRPRCDDVGATALLAPSVGIFTPRVAEAELVASGQCIGTIEVLGVHRKLLVPDGVAGHVEGRIGGGRTRVAVEYGDALVVVATGMVTIGSPERPASGALAESALAFVAPMSGRFYSRPSPNDPPFVSEGDTVSYGQTVGLLEVMKTFNRLVYQGDGLPDRAVIERIAPADGDDVVRGDPILVLTSREGH